MINESIGSRSPLQALDPSGQAQASAVSWPAIFAGATGAAALSLVLLLLGSGLGLSAVSPWADRGASVGLMGLSTILWITLTQVAAAGTGGYIAGRLRTPWHGTHTDEVYFRDTAHGFLAWALATVVTAATLTSAIGAIVSGSVKVGAAAGLGELATSAPSAVGAMGTGRATGQATYPYTYSVDALFRKDPSGPASTTAATPATAADQARTTSEVARILATNLSSGSLTSDDMNYVAQLVAQHTGMSQADAAKRVSQGFAQLQANEKAAEAMTRDAADKARKASAYAALWLVASLLIGAFCASFAATYGGRRRDQF